MPSTQPRQGGRVNSPQDEDEKKLDDEHMPDGGGERSSQTLGEKADARRNKKRFRSVSLILVIKKDLTSSDSRLRKPGSLRLSLQKSVFLTRRIGSGSHSRFPVSIHSESKSGSRISNYCKSLTWSSLTILQTCQSQKTETRRPRFNDKDESSP